MLDPEAISQFFVSDARGNSVEINKVISENSEKIQTSEIRARSTQSKEPWHTSNSFGIDGTPGIPFERGIPNPDLFFQGEDIIFDILLIQDGKKVTPENFDINVIVKSSPRAVNNTYAASIENGIYPWTDEPGYFELWIPASISATMLAGTYILAVQISERVGEGAGRYDRKSIALQHYFNIEPGNFSTNVESALNSLRTVPEKTWPNSPSTINNA